MSDQIPNPPENANDDEQNEEKIQIESNSNNVSSSTSVQQQQQPPNESIPINNDNEPQQQLTEQVSNLSINQNNEETESKVIETEEITQTNQAQEDHQSDADEDSDDESEDIGDNEWLGADHPLLSRMQIALKQRLERQLNRVNLSIITKEEDLSALEKEREDIGVELYHRQQELASEQIKLETVNNKYNNIEVERVEAENGLDELRKAHSELIDRLKEQKKKETESRQELDSLNESLKHIILYQDNMKKEILNQRRSAYSAEEIMQEMEGQKIKQDLLINHLEKKINNFSSQIEIYQIQLKIQEEETLAAKEILRESLSEMDLIKSEKREYMNKWKSSLIEVNKRDDILKNIQKILDDIEEQIRLKKIEIIQYEKDIGNKQEQIDMQQIRMSKINNDKEQIEAKLTENIKNRDLLMNKLRDLKVALNSNESDLRANKIEEKRFNENLVVLEKRYVKIMGDIHSIETKIENNYSDHITLKHGTENTMNAIRKTSNKIHEKEFIVENLKNEISKLRLNEITSKQILNDLNDSYKECQRTLEYNSQIIEEYEREFKKGIDELGKKTNVLDRLNNKLEVLARNNAIDAAGDEVASPLEHTIHHLSKELKASKEKCNELQKKWIVKQTELVQLVNESMKQSEFVTNLNCRETILYQKKIRLMNEIKCIDVEISTINKNINGLRLDVVKLNKHIAAYNGKYATLCVEYENVESKYKIDLEVGEEEANKMKEKIDAVNEEKAAIIESITDCEKQILLWERKIKLEAETQRALDPNYGKSEVEDMKREIHRMETRLSQLKRKQEDIIKEMELSIDKKEMIQLSHMGKSQMNASASRNNVLLNKKQISNLKVNIKSSMKEKKYIVDEIENNTQKYNQLLDKCNELNGRLNELNEQKNGLKDNILQKSVLQKVYLNNIVAKQKLVKDIQKSEKKEYNEEEMDKKYTKQMDKLEKMKQQIVSLSEKYPQFEAVFDIIVNDNIENDEEETAVEVVEQES